MKTCWKTLYKKLEMNLITCVMISPRLCITRNLLLSALTHDYHRKSKKTKTTTKNKTRLSQLCIYPFNKILKFADMTAMISLAFRCFSRTKMLADIHTVTINFDQLFHVLYSQPPCVLLYETPFISSLYQRLLRAVLTSVCSTATPCIPRAATV